MDRFIALEKRVATLGNHLQKFIHIIKRQRYTLISDIERSGKLLQSHLWHSSFTIPEDMKIVSTLTDNLGRNVKNLSCYYALQYLHMIFRNIDIMTLGLVSGKTPIEVYNQFLLQFGQDFRTLSQAYMQNLIDLYLAGNKFPDFIICSVGTRTDQDDLDLGIITEGEEDLSHLNYALQKITQDMLVYATPLHLHLSEHVGQRTYTTTIKEYAELLQTQFRDVVIISEILNAKLILGKKHLFNKFHKQVVEKYFYHPGRDIRFHEGFLRGIMGEARAWLLSPPQTDAISPKEDALRMLKSILYAKKVVFRIKKVNPWEILTDLIKHEPHLRSEYELLARALSFLEMFKFLLQLHIIQEEVFRPPEIGSEQLNLLANQMGYKPIGTVSSWDQLIIDYYRYVKEVRRLSEFFLDNLREHLGSISLVVKTLKKHHGNISHKKAQYERIARFINTAQFYSETKYWEDVLDVFRRDTAILDEFIAGFKRLNNEEREELIRLYLDWARYTLITIIRFITLIGRREVNKIGDTLFSSLSHSFLIFIEGLPHSAERLSRIYSHYPEVLHELMQLLPEKYFEYLDRILQQPVISDRLAEYHKQIKELCNIHRWSGQYFHRFFYRVIANYPEYLSAITNPAQLSKIASGFLAMMDVHREGSEKKKVLGAFYDLEFLRVGIGTMHGVDLMTTNHEFTEFCDRYLKSLLEICSEEIEQEINGPVPGPDNFAVLAAGGHARRQAYDDDYDLIAIITTEDPDILYQATKIMTRVNREVLNRGMLPHYRLGEILGSFVNPISRITEYLESDKEENFIDLSQLLGARIIAGSSDMEETVEQNILKPFIYDQKEVYCQRMIQEIRNREKLYREKEAGVINLKEAPGGLRDIEAIALMLKAQTKINAPLSETYFEIVKPGFSAISGELDILSESVYLLRTIRNLYRLMVSAEDKIQEHYLGRLGAVFGQSQHPEWSNPQAIMERIQHSLKRSADARDVIINSLG